MVEIASLTEHLLTECEKKENFAKCSRCCEALPKEELARHAKGRACNRQSFPPFRSPLLPTGPFGPLGPSPSG